MGYDKEESCPTQRHYIDFGTLRDDTAHVTTNA